MAMIGRLELAKFRHPNGRNRRFSPVAVSRGEGLLAEPIAGAQQQSHESALMPLFPVITVRNAPARGRYLSRQPKGGLRWVSRRRPNPVGLQQCEASSNVLWARRCTVLPRPRQIARAPWDAKVTVANSQANCFLSLYCETLTLSRNRAGVQTGKADQHARKLQKA